MANWYKVEETTVFGKVKKVAVYTAYLSINGKPQWCSQFGTVKYFNTREEALDYVEERKALDRKWDEQQRNTKVTVIYDDSPTVTSKKIEEYNKKAEQNAQRKWFPFWS